MRLAPLAVCQLNQWALDVSGNLARTRASIERARADGARYRLGPELELTGYGCGDHFLERDLAAHAWEAVAALLASGHTDRILVDLGAPVRHRSVLYNCRLLLLNRRVLLVRPKLVLADDGNFFETRRFAAWPPRRALEAHMLPECITAVAGQTEAPFGPALLRFADGAVLGLETCEELWAPSPSHVPAYLAGAHVVANASASHHRLRKLAQRVDLVARATTSGGAYLYANALGCDGDRLYYDGAALAALNGRVVARAPQFGLDRDVVVETVVVDLDDVDALRGQLRARAEQAVRVAESHGELARVDVPGFALCADPRTARRLRPRLPLSDLALPSPQEEIALGPACWLWDYLRRSGLNGFFLPLSGGADSAATAAIVGSMCQQLVSAVEDKNAERTRLLSDIRRVTGTGDTYVPKDARELAGRLFRTLYMGHGAASSAETRERARRVAEEIGAVHRSVEIDGVVDTLLRVFKSVFPSRIPRFRAHGGSAVENLALQCLQARARMVIGYLFAQLALWAEGRAGALLVLGSANVDEGLRGYLTKYDCSSADLNPIGGISKTDLKEFLRWAAREDGLAYPALSEVVQARPSAELEPIVGGQVQTDEEDMGMSYEELSWFGRLRMLERCGPFAMYEKLVNAWRDRMGVKEVAEKVKFFFRMYSINRHKQTVLTPSYFAEDYSPDDNRFDMRPFLYNVRWPWQFAKIDEDVLTRSADEEEKSTAKEGMPNGVAGEAD